MKFRWLSAVILVGLCLSVTVGAALGQDETPPAPYAGMKNPFPWDDAAAQAAGKSIYQQQCSGCHGAIGSSLSAFDFSRPAFSQELQTRPDFFFWILSEGRISQGMPGFKSSLSADQIWQMLTYMWTMGSAPPPELPPPTALPSIAGASLALLTLDKINTGQAVTFGAVLKDSEDKPVSGALVRFFLKEDFFASGLMEIGNAVTDQQGMATISYIPTRAGETMVAARYGTIETQASLTIDDTGAVFYHSEAGLQSLGGGPEVFIGPRSSHQLDEMGNAPTSALRLPGGFFSWLWVVLGILLLVWGTYFVIMYQVMHIPADGASRVTASRLVPVIGLIVILCLGLLMLFMVITGPYSHFHLMH